VVDTWRFLDRHLWVEAFLELFVTVMVATLFYKLGMVTRQTAARVIYLVPCCFLAVGSSARGITGTYGADHGLYGAVLDIFSDGGCAANLADLDATHFMRLAHGHCDVCGKSINLPHKWTFYFLIAVGV